MKLGVIADDFTGATDIAGFLVENGIQTIQILNEPGEDVDIQADAYVVSLKSRSCPPEEAVGMSLRTLEWLLWKKCTHIYFKYCSTFDSTREGNIGPVADAILKRLGEKMTVVCPALPVNGRTVYQGYLFVYDQLLNESGMKNHPVTPMLDAKVGRILGSQTNGKIGEVGTFLIENGPEAVKNRLAELKAHGCRYAVLDTLNDAHLDCLAKAVQDFRFLTGGSGLAAGLARLWRSKGPAEEKAENSARPSRNKTVILSGSCSLATNRQVTRYKERASSIFIDAWKIIHEPGYIEEIVRWTEQHLNEKYAPMLYATKTPEELSKSKEEFGDNSVGGMIESFFGSLALRFMEVGVRNFIVAGGETAGKIVQSMKLKAFFIGPQIAPGVPWTKSVDRDVYLALKSGNFGDDDFFRKAQEFFDD